MRYLYPIVLSALLLVGCVKERTGVSHNEVPGPVMATIEKNAQPGQITSIVRETREKSVTYLATVTHEGRAWVVAVEGDGDFMYKKEK